MLCSLLLHSYYLSLSWSLSWTRAVPYTWSRDGVSCWIFSCAGSLFCLKSLHLASSWQQVGHTTCSLLLSYVRERGNANTLAACSVSSCICCFVPVNQVCVGPFREHGTHCNDREQVHEPDFLSSRLAENIDFAFFARFGRHFLSLSLPAAARPLIKWLLDNVHAWRREAQEACENVWLHRLLSLRRRCANYLYFTHWLIITYKHTLVLIDSSLRHLSIVLIAKKRVKCHISLLRRLMQIKFITTQIN